MRGTRLLTGVLPQTPRMRILPIESALAVFPNKAEQKAEQSSHAMECSSEVGAFCKVWVVASPEKAKNVIYALNVEICSSQEVSF